MLTEMRDTLGLVMLGEGKDPATATADDAKAACAKIKKYRENGQIRAFTGNDYAEDLAAGNIAVAIAWSGDIQGLAADNPDLRVDRAEGRRRCCSPTTCSIPKTSRPDRPGDGLDELRATIRCVSAQIVAGRAVHFGRSRAPAPRWPRSHPTWPPSPLVNPPDDVRARLHVFRALDDAEDQEFNRLFQDAIGA